MLSTNAKQNPLLCLKKVPCRVRLSDEPAKQVVVLAKEAVDMQAWSVKGIYWKGTGRPL